MNAPATAAELGHALDEARERVRELEAHVDQLYLERDEAKGEVAMLRARLERVRYVVDSAGASIREALD